MDQSNLSTSVVNFDSVLWARVAQLRTRYASNPVQNSHDSQKRESWFANTEPGDKTRLDSLVAAAGKLGYTVVIDTDVVMQRTRQNPATYGFTVSGEKLIAVRHTASVPVQTFTLAHELGHALLDEIGYRLDWLSVAIFGADLLGEMVADSLAARLTKDWGMDVPLDVSAGYIAAAALQGSRLDIETARQLSDTIYERAKELLAE